MGAMDNTTQAGASSSPLQHRRLTDLQRRPKTLLSPLDKLVSKAVQNQWKEKDFEGMSVDEKKGYYYAEIKAHPLGPVIHEIIQNGQAGSDLEELFKESGIGKPDDMLSMVRDITSYLKKSKIIKDQLKLYFEKKDSQGQTLYAAIRVRNENGLPKVSLLGDKLLKRGQYKKIRAEYEINASGGFPEKVLVSREKFKDEKGDLIKASDINVRNEMRVLDVLKKNNVSGTPDTRSISVLRSKGKALQMVIRQKYYLGGNLDELKSDSAITIDQKKKIALQICQTLSEIHKLSISHNDLKGANIVLDVKNGEYSPIIIDYGGATFEGDPALQIGSLMYFPPEILNRKAFDNYSKTLDEIDDLHDKMHHRASDIYDDLLEMETDLNEPVPKNPDYARMSHKQKKAEGDRLRDEADTFIDNVFDKLAMLQHDAIKIDDPQFNAWKKDIMTKKQEMEQYEKEFKASINVELFDSKKPEKKGWIPQKNDNFALGMILEEFFDQNIPTDVRKILDALLEEDPQKRMTSEQAYQAFAKITSV